MMTLDAYETSHCPRKKNGLKCLEMSVVHEKTGISQVCSGCCTDDFHSYTRLRPTYLWLCRVIMTAHKREMFWGGYKILQKTLFRDYVWINVVLIQITMIKVSRIFIMTYLDSYPTQTAINQLNIAQNLMCVWTFLLSWGCCMSVIPWRSSSNRLED